MAGTNAAATMASIRPPASCRMPTRKAPSASGLLTTRPSSEPPRTAKTERTGTGITKRLRAAAESNVQMTKKARRSQVAKAMNQGRSARSVASTSRCQSVAQPNA